MRRVFRKREFPVENVRQFLEPGPIVLVSSAWQGKTNIMTMGWHMIMEMEPSLIGAYIWEENHSFEMILQSKECVINVPTVDLLTTVVNVGQSHGFEVDKFRKFKLTAAPSHKVKAPRIEECYANIECRLIDTGWVKKYSLFVFEAVHALAATSPKHPTTIHYRGQGQFMIAGRSVNLHHRYPDLM